MSTATAVEAPPPAKGKKKLIIIIAAASAVALAGGGGGAWYVMKKNANAAAAEAEAADAEGDTGNAAAAHTPAKPATKHDPKAVPTFVPLDAFTVNLADRDAERYAQIGITLEIEDSHTADLIRAYMPAIRNNILMTIADRTAGELMGRDGKSVLAEKIRRETSRAIGVAVEDDEPAADPKAPPRKKKKAPTLPVTAVHFSNFIIQ